MGWWSRLTRPWENVDESHPRRDYEAHERLLAGVDRQDAVAIRTLERAFYGFANELNDPRFVTDASAELEREPRWLDLAARCRRGPCQGGARVLLNEQSREVVADLVRRHPLPVAAPALVDASLLLSYRTSAGTRGAEFERLGALGRVDGELRVLTLRAAMTQLEPLARNADEITNRLRSLGWPVRERARRTAEELAYLEGAVDAPDGGDVLTLPAQIEQMAGFRVPVMLEAFWRTVPNVLYAPEKLRLLP